MSWIEAVDSRLVVLVALVFQLAAAEVGWILGLRRSPEIDAGQRFQSGAVQAALLALLALLLGFSFSMAVGRYDARRDLVVEESNAIGTAYLRAGMLPEPERLAVRGLLRDYVDTRVAFFEDEDPGAVARSVQASEVLLGQLWKRVTAAGGAGQDPLPRSMVVESTNRVIDLHAERVAANESRIPPSILVLLIGASVAGLGTIGWCFGLCRGHHRGPCVLYAVLVATILLVILDLDEPLHGRIRVDQGSLRHLQEELTGL